MAIDNKAAINAFVNGPAAKALGPTIDQLAEKHFKQIKNEMMKEFLDHKITKELLGGARAKNTSNTLGGLDGQNLFTFIGFYEGELPIEPILFLLEEVKLGKRVYTSRGRGRWTYNVNMPSAEDIWRVTPMPFWAGDRSWAQGIELGISGLGFLVRAEKTPNSSSLSGYAFQRKKRVRPGKFQNTTYISEFVKKYKKKFETIK